MYTKYPELKSDDFGYFLAKLRNEVLGDFHSNESCNMVPVLLVPEDSTVDAKSGELFVPEDYAQKEKDIEDHTLVGIALESNPPTNYIGITIFCKYGNIDLGDNLLMVPIGNILLQHT